LTCASGIECETSYCTDDRGCYNLETEECKLQKIIIGVTGAVLGAGAIVGVVIAIAVCAAGTATASVATYNWATTGDFGLQNPLFEPATEVVQNPAYGRKSVWGKKKEVEKSQSGESLKSQSEDKDESD